MDEDVYDWAARAVAELLQRCFKAAAAELEAIALQLRRWPQ